MSGNQVREMILNSGVKIWQVAKALGIADSTLSRRFRFDFSEDETEKIKGIIEDLKKKE